MALYAQQADVENYIAGWTTSDALDLERLIERCEEDIEPILVNASSLATPPYQVVALQGATGGTFKVNWNGLHPASTPNEPYGVSAAQLQADLQAMVDIGAANVAVLGQYPVFTVLWTIQWARGFTNYVIPPLTVDASGLTPVGTATVITVRGRKVNPLLINANQQLSLAAATCAQVEFRSSMGEDFFVRPQFESVQGPDFTTKGRLSTIAPKVRRELTASGLMLRGGRAIASHGRLTTRTWPTY